MTPSSTNWEKSSKKVHLPESIIGINIEPLFQNNSDALAHVNYNDQPPHETPMIYNGHTKGVVITDTTGGYWLQHSVPHFPGNLSIASAYPPGGLENGQMFFCLSLTVQEIDRIGSVLEYTKPDIYNYNIPAQFGSLLPQLVEVTSKKWNKKVTTMVKIIELSNN